MDIRDFLAASNVAIDVRSGNKKGLLKALAAKVAPALGLSSDAIAAALERRDELGSTGFGGGVAIPHARLPEIVKPVGYLARLGAAIEFDAIDGKPVDIVFVLLMPEANQADQSKTLACAARKLRDPDVLQRLRSASTKADLYKAIAS